MEVLIGVDEAGYGPNYGPLVVAATAWRVEAEGVRSQGSGAKGRKRERAGGSSTTAATRRTRAKSSATADLRQAAGGGNSLPDLYARLAEGVVRSPVECARRLAIADSKALYKAGLGLRQLERGVLAALLNARASIGAQVVATFGELIAATGADPHERRRELACHDGDDGALPVELTSDEIAECATVLDGACGRCGVALLGIRARLVYPCEFNSLCDALGTKGAALSHVTLALVRELIDQLHTAHCPLPTSIYLDKHGGRSRYAALVQHHFPDSWVDSIDERRAESRYRWDHGGVRVEAAFRVGCEEFLPTALASMTAKYHRELAMRAFNSFWAGRVPGVRPTAGYPGDASRFRTAIAAAQAELGIADRVLWRNR